MAIVVNAPRLTAPPRPGLRPRLQPEALAKYGKLKQMSTAVFQNYDIIDTAIDHWLNRSAISGVFATAEGVLPSASNVSFDPPCARIISITSACPCAAAR